MTGTGQDEPQVRALAAHEREGLEKPVMILVLPAVRGVEEERLARATVRREPLVVDGQVDRAHPLGIEAEPLDQRFAGVLADRDHDPALAHRPAVHEAPVGELRA